MAELDRMGEKEQQISDETEDLTEEKLLSEEHCKTTVTVGRLRSSQR